MNDDSTFKQILRYMDELHQDLGRLVVLIERLMPEKGYVPFPSAGNRIGWALSSHYATPDRWRLTNLSRFYAREGEELIEQSLAYFINLATDTRFSFPTILCAQIKHTPMLEKNIYTRVWNIDRLFSFGQKESAWRTMPNEDGWFVVAPLGETPVQSLRGYLLNVFDLVDRQHVVDNIILPLTEPGANLDELLTIEKYSLVAAEESAA